MEKEKTIIEEEDEVFTVVYDDGSEEEFYVVAELDYKGKWYRFAELCNAAEEGSEMREVEVFEIREVDEENDELIPVEDEKLRVKLVEMLNGEIKNA